MKSKTGQIHSADQGKKIPAIFVCKNGAGLLEVVVAMTLLATTGISIYIWTNTTLASVRRAEEVSGKIHAQSIVFEYLKGINPMQHPLGEEQLGQYRVSWQAKELETPKISKVQNTGVNGNFMVGLYEIGVTVGDNGEDITSFNFRSVGYKKIASSIIDF